RLSIGARQHDTRPLQPGLARYAFAAPIHRVPIALEHVVGTAHTTCRVDELLKRIEADICLQCLDRSCRLARARQNLSESIIDKIGIEGEGSLELGDGGVVLALVSQDLSKLSASLRQAVVEVHRRLRQFKGATERSGTKIIAVERLDITV